MRNKNHIQLITSGSVYLFFSNHRTNLFFYHHCTSLCYSLHRRIGKKKIYSISTLSLISTFSNCFDILGCSTLDCFVIVLSLSFGLFVFSYTTIWISLCLLCLIPFILYCKFSFDLYFMPLFLICLWNWSLSILLYLKLWIFSNLKSFLGSH